MAETTGIIEQYAQHLERKASGLVLRFTAFGALVGAALGGFPLFQSASSALVPHHFGYATLLLGAAAGGYLGWSVGERRAIEPRFQAQIVLRQLQVEQTLMRQVAARPAAPAAPVPVATPAPAPAPVAVAPTPVPAAVAPPAAPPVVEVAPTPPPLVEVAPPPAPLPAPAPLPEPAPAEEESLPPAAFAAPPQLVQPPLSSTGA